MWTQDFPEPADAVRAISSSVIQSRAQAGIRYHWSVSELWLIRVNNLHARAL
jgi:hypothetical protein